MKTNPIKYLTDLAVDFRNKRNWVKFHNPKDVSISLMLEAAELLEHFQWKNQKEITKHLKEHKKEISDELADVLYWILILSHDLKIDIRKALENKIMINEKKYPIEKSYGKHTKYNEL